MRKDILVKALRAAGEELLKYDPAKVEASVKSTAGDLVTAADLAIEKIITQVIETAFPEDVIISEETTAGHAALNHDNLPQLAAWVIDPIDGTNNFKRGMAYSGISIGYIEAGEAILGGIFDPYRNLLYLAEKGKGASCNGRLIHVSSVAQLDGGARVCTSNSTTKGGTVANLDKLKNLNDVWVDVLGSAVLIMADVACGRLDLYFHNGLKPWDNAAGFLIAKEAGAKVVGRVGQPVNWLSSEVVMGNPQLVDLFLAKVD